MQRIDDRADHHRQGGRGAAFAAGLDAERIGWRQHLDNLRPERWQCVGARHAVVHERAAHRLAARRIDDALLPHRLADALRNAAVSLAVHDERIDAAADVVDRCIPRDRHMARVGVDLYLADRAAVRKYRIVHLVVGGGAKPVLELEIGMLGGLSRQFEEVEVAVAGRRRESAVLEPHAVLGRVEHRGRDLSRLGDQVVRGLGDHRAGVAHGTPRVGAAAHADDVGVADHDVHGLDRQVQQIGRDLREARLVALAARLGADHHADPAVRPHHDFGTLLRRADRGLDVIRKPETQQLAALPRLALALLEPVDVRDAHGKVHVGLVGAAVVAHADRVEIRKLLRRDEILAAQPKTIEAEFVGRLVDQPFDRERDLRPPRAAVRVGRHGVGERRARAHGRGRNIVRAGDQACALRERRQRDAQRADIAHVVGAHGEKPAVLADGELDARQQIAALVIGKKSLRARGGEFHRTADLLRSPHDEAEFDVGPVARAEVAADVEAEDAHLVGRHAQHAGELLLVLYRAAAAGMQGVAAGLLVVVAETGAQLHRDRGDAPDVIVHRHDMVGRGERAIGRFPVAEGGIGEHVVGHFLPHRRCARLDRVGGLNDERQLLVFDLHRFGGIHRLHASLRHHHRQRLANVPCLVGGHQVMEADEHGAAIGRTELYVVFRRRRSRVLDRVETVRPYVGAGEHAEYARHCSGLRGVDPDDARMRMRGAHHRRVGLAVHREIVGEPPLAGQQALVLLAAQRLADGLERSPLGDGNAFAHGAPAFTLARLVPRTPFIPAQAGIQGATSGSDLEQWVPAFAGRNGKGNGRWIIRQRRGLSSSGTA